MSRGRKCLIDPDRSVLANSIVSRILYEFSVKYRDNKKNYWGISSGIPKRLVEIVDDQLKENDNDT